MIIYSVYMQNVNLRYFSITSFVKGSTNIWTGIDSSFQWLYVAFLLVLLKYLKKCKIFLKSFYHLRIFPPPETWCSSSFYYYDHFIYRRQQFSQSSLSTMLPLANNILWYFNWNRIVDFLFSIVRKYNVIDIYGRSSPHQTICNQQKQKNAVS